MHVGWQSHGRLLVYLRTAFLMHVVSGLGGQECNVVEGVALSKQSYAPTIAQQHARQLLRKVDADKTVGGGGGLSEVMDAMALVVRPGFNGVVEAWANMVYAS